MASVTLSFARLVISSPPKKEDLIKILYSDLKSFGMRGSYKRNRKGFLNFKQDNDFLTFNYYKDLPSRSQFLNQENSGFQQDNYTDSESKMVIIFSDGYIAYEGFGFGRGSFMEIKNRIIDALGSSKFPGKIKIEEIKEFDYKLLKEFYTKAESVSILKITDPGKIKPNPHFPSKYMKQIIEDYGKYGETAGFSTEHKKDKNLKKTRLIDRGFLPISKPLYVKGKEQGGISFKISINGKVSFYTSDDPEKKEIRMVELAKRIIGFFRTNGG